ncbi:UDP-glucose--hexose-1-phosphate uridylyltransferase [Vallitalea okinawensis]|uniref:UDP-glucose--hexose-1-phosphate uridylyltransferase n=1 Tax=Vallitalea okinawensis TaxID=2078660 RepID=UPI000CFAD02A|nr:UDP-glucose--hexose-1-phosphate uridylyltransferase [Vallitalea okinawensis]
MKRIQDNIEKLLQYAVKSELIDQWDVDQKRNELMDLLHVEEPGGLDKNQEDSSLHNILDEILSGLIESGHMNDTVVERDLMDTKIMGLLVDRQSNVIKDFWHNYEMRPKNATNYLYNLSQRANYIRTDRIAKNEEWLAESAYGKLKITINLSKPELDAKAIEQMKNAKQTAYPKCFLCKENVGYKGRFNHQARQNLRIIPLQLGDATWYMQYSPYTYFNEHCILLAEEHKPMKIDDDAFVRLFDFVDQFPHYFIGSNAGLPIIGGSILNHDHYQGGSEVFPIDEVDYEKKYTCKESDVVYGSINWPMSVIRIQGSNREEVLAFCQKVFNNWVHYENNEVGIIPFTDGEQHNGVSLLLRKVEKQYIMHMILRNNRTSEEKPKGIFHQSEKYYHIKEENIGIIETLGQAILPGRLKKELNVIKESLLSGGKGNPHIESELISKHEHWIKLIKDKYASFDSMDLDELLIKEIADVYTQILQDVSVFKVDDMGIAAFHGFLEDCQG